MTVYELRQLLFDVEDQNAVVKVNGKNIKDIETAYHSTLVRIKTHRSSDFTDEVGALLLDDSDSF
jgi:hypothetical protein